MRRAGRWAAALAGCLLIAAVGGADDPKTKAPGGTEGKSTSPASGGAVPDAHQAGGEPDGIVQVANLVYAGTKSSRCFSDHFLIKAEKESSISTSRRFHAVKLGSENVFEFPLVIMTGEGDFQLTAAERENLRRYVAARRLPAGVGQLLVAANGTTPSAAKWRWSSRSIPCKPSRRVIPSFTRSTRFPNSRGPWRESASAGGWA